jgi:long-chain fatty acid transport protein
MYKALLTLSITIGCLPMANILHAQSFGVELHNSLMPASGAMGGVSIARPQDLTSALNANPAALTQFQGTQFLFGGSWAEATFNLTQTSNIPVVGPGPLVEPYSGKSTAPGAPGGNIGLTQDLKPMGIPVVMGMGFISAAGGSVDFRHIPESGGTNSGLVIFNMPMSVGIELTEKLSVGGSIGLGIAFFDGPFVGVGGMTPDYALRGTLGTNYLLTDKTTIGAYYQTEQSFRFDNAIDINPGSGLPPSDVNMELPQNVGIGVANSTLLDGNLLLGLDVIYKLYDQAELFKSVYDDQWVVQIGGQYTRGRYQFRSGYTWAQDPLDDNPGPNLGGVIQPGGLPAVRYSQGLLAVTSQHRISAGIGVSDVLPGMNFDFMAGGMFKDSAQLGDFTTTSIASYWVGLGMTWQFGTGSNNPE